MIIAIDGTAASGKGTLGRTLAMRLHFDYLDTGLLYRAVGYFSLEKGLDLDKLNKEEETLKDELSKLQILIS